MYYTTLSSEGVTRREKLEDVIAAYFAVKEAYELFVISGVNDYYYEYFVALEKVKTFHLSAIDKMDIITILKNRGYLAPENIFTLLKLE